MVIIHVRIIYEIKRKSLIKCRNDTKTVESGRKIFYEVTFSIVLFLTEIPLMRAKWLPIENCVFYYYNTSANSQLKGDSELCLLWD